MSIKQQIVLGTFEVEVELTDYDHYKGIQLSTRTEDDEYGYSTYDEIFSEYELAKLMLKNGISVGEYRLEIKVIRV